jgi:hypothetical protein
MHNKLHLLARRLAILHPRGGTIDVTAPLPQAAGGCVMKFTRQANQPLLPNYHADGDLSCADVRVLYPVDAGCERRV